MLQQVKDWPKVFKRKTDFYDDAKSREVRMLFK